ncbi:hypothetical protein BDR06DRAFT_973282 [Suillus hirtellus]|nr:hypothetical protein BDR06DRAFT_973282 [Suillus hirtellus]
MTDKLFVTNKTLTEQLRVTQDVVKSLKVDFLEFSSKFGSESKSSKKTATKNSSNEHSKLKSIIHPLFTDLCGIDSALSYRKHAELLCAIKPLENGEALGTLDGNEIWHPNWMGKINDDINAHFVKAVIDHTWDNDDYKKDIITECTKGYWRNIHKQVTKSRCQATLKYENQSGNKGALTIIDTDFTSDVLSYSESELLADTIQQRKKADIGKTANLVQGHQWHSVDKPNTDTENVAGPAKENSGEPAKKHHKTVQHKKLVKKKWRDDHLEMQLLDGALWLKGFYESLKEDDLLKEDRDYLKELIKWHDDEGGAGNGHDSKDSIDTGRGVKSWVNKHRKLGFTILIFSKFSQMNIDG